MTVAPEGSSPRRAPAGTVRILVADDDEAVLRSVARCLERRGFAVLTAREGCAAYQIAAEAVPRLVVADAEMPGLDGFELCRALRADPRTRAVLVLLMSGARTAENDQLAGLGGGADDYLLKPFSLRILEARIRALLRRFEAPSTGILEAAGLRLDPDARTVSVRGRRVHLRPKEFDLLATLLRSPGRVRRTLELLEAVWGYDPADYNDTHTVEVHVSSLRRKLGEAGRSLVSVTGYGYKFEPEG